MVMAKAPAIDPKIASELISAWQERPQILLRDLLGLNKIWRLQDELLNACPQAIKEHKQIYVASGHALGKDYISAAIALWFLHSYSPSIVIQTAPTDRQVKQIMWGETLKHWGNRKLDMGGKVYTDPYIEIKKGEWYLIGFTTKESGASRDAQGGKFQGFHCPNICVIVSEAQAVEDSIFDQIDAITTSENCLVIFLGNPTRTTGRFAKGLRNKLDNIVFNFSCLDNPNYKHNKTIIPGLVSYEWVEDKRKKWGEDDPRWQSRVLGELPKTSINTVISEDLYQKCIKRELFNTKRVGSIGIDPAMYGNDDLVISAMESGKLLEEKIIPTCSAKEGCAEAAMLQKKHFPEGQITFSIDCDGLGASWPEILRDMVPDQLQCHYIEFHGAGKPEDEQYANARAEIAFYAQEEMRNGRISLNDDEFAKEEAISEEYFENTRGKTQLIDKDDLKEVLGRSPNRWDARKLAIWGQRHATVIHPKDRYAFDEDYSDSMVPERTSWLVV